MHFSTFNHCIDHWKIVGEGKVRIAFANVCNESPYFGFVLLIVKLEPTMEIEQNANLLFIQNTMFPWFSKRFLSDLQIVELASRFIDELLLKARCCSKRMAETETLSSFALLQRNLNEIYKGLPDMVHYVAVSNTISFEIKVKNGVPSRSPFLNGPSLIKLNHSRFDIMQIFKASKMKDKLAHQPWGLFNRVSGYNPALLISSDIADIKQTLFQLLLNPQNNLRITVNNNHCYGWDKDCLAGMYEVIAEDELKTCFLEGVSSILHREDLLSSLKRMQELDVLDSEGIAVVYDRLVSLFQSSVDFCSSDDSCSDALRTLADVQLAVNDYLLNHFCLPTVDTEKEQRDSSLLDSLNDLCMRPLDSSEVCEAKRRAAVSLIHTASKEECAALAKRWMMGLVASDASLVVTLRPVDISSVSCCDIGGPLQTENCCGVVVLPSHNGKEAAAFAYSLEMVDLGLKDFRKMWTKVNTDNKICTEFIQFVNRKV
jgi:hypothetical protein